MVDLFTAAWPVIMALVGLIIVLAQMHSSIEILKEKVRTLFELFNNSKK